MRLFAILTGLLGVVACTGAPDASSPRAAAAGTASATATASAADTLVISLSQAGLTVRSAGTVEQPFFSVPARVYTVDGDDLQLYEFPTAESAQAAAATVSASGGSIGTSSMSWLAPPHFFHKDRLIANYLGSSSKTLAALETILGPQFAGQ